MGYYVLENKDGYASDPGFMQNFVALGGAVGKNLQQRAMKDAVDKNGLIPEYKQDESGNVSIDYKSPALISKYYTQGAPGNTDKKVEKPEDFGKAIKQIIAKQAMENATQEAGQYGQRMPNSDVGIAPGNTVTPEGGIVNSEGNQVGEVPAGTKFDTGKVFQDALLRQSQENPIVAKSVGLPQQKTKMLTKGIATQLLAQAGGDKEAARQLAKKLGYTF